MPVQMRNRFGERGMSIDVNPLIDSMHTFEISGSTSLARQSHISPSRQDAIGQI